VLRWLIFVLRLAAAVLKSRRILLLDNLALRHQLLVVSRNAKRARWPPLDRALWAWLSHVWSRGRNFLRLDHGWRTHLGLDKDAPQARRVQGSEEGKIIAFPEVGGLHHRYERQAA
jgi:hypothetical protein